MLKQCDLEIIDDRTVQAGEVEQLIREEFTEDAAVLVECTKFASLEPLSEAKIADNLNMCLRMIVSSKSSELRLEKKGNGAFFCRIIHERPGTKYYIRKDRLLFRKTSRISPSIFNGGAGRIVNREYYTADNDGMLVFVADRLAEIVTA